MKPKPSLLSTEQKQLRQASGLLLFCAITGFITCLIPTQTVSVQWLYLAHIVSAIPISLWLTSYIVVHFRRTLGVRRASLLLSGLLLISALLIMMATGYMILVHGQQESKPWLLPLHVSSAIASILLLAVHIILHVASPDRRRDQTSTRFNSFAEFKLKHILIPLFICTALLMIGATIYTLFPVQYSTTPVVKDYQYPYGEHPFRPSQTETWGHQFIDYKQIATSTDCASCHADIAKQWKSSAHRQAASDKTYVTNISLLSEKKGITATRYCEGCHAPIALLTGQLSKGGDHGGVANTIANTEGIGCLGCHGINQAVHLKGVASYEYKPPVDYLFAGRDSAVFTELRHLLIRTKPELHKADMAKPILAQPNLCATCHVQFMDKDMNGWGWVKMQDEFTAWLNSPYSQQHQQTFADSKITRCQDCHMPMQSSNDPSANMEGKVHAHHFAAANSMLPLIDNDTAQLQLVADFLRQDKLRITIEEPHRQDATQTLATIKEGFRTQEEGPFYYYLGETANLRIIVNNTGVGHNFPGGTTDINEAWISLTAVDAEGHVIYQSGNILPDNSLDPNAHIYRAIPLDRKGDIVWRHDLFNRIGEAFENSIPAGQSDSKDYQFPIPNWAKGPLTITASVKYRKLNVRYAQWAMKEKYQPLPVIDMAKTSLVIPVQIKPDVYDVPK